VQISNPICEARKFSAIGNETRAFFGVGPSCAELTNRTQNSRGTLQQSGLRSQWPCSSRLTQHQLSQAVAKARPGFLYARFAHAVARKP